MGLILILGFAFLVCIAIAVVALQSASRLSRPLTEDDWQGWTAGISLFIALVLLIVTMVFATAVPLSKSRTATDLEAFFDANAAVYEDAVNRTENMLTITLERLPETTLIPIQGSVEKLELAKATAAAITEWRSQVVWYNEEIKWYHMADKSWLVGSLYPTIPDRLVPIRLQNEG